MTNLYKKVALFIALIVLSTATFAQEQAPQVEMADALYQSGKIYVVITVIAIIFTGIIAYLIVLDRKISKLEKQNNK
ncbi:MAG: CcmD family protein [Bacteroidia bacterium]